mmetsp:Transcript_100493/g.273285  ORF Transcript_100493/g.273285 Transcript_100493/m.273285 type:complete len:292 (-) Transcript_100493:199-1074(-)
MPAPAAPSSRGGSAEPHDVRALGVLGTPARASGSTAAPAVLLVDLGEVPLPLLLLLGPPEGLPLAVLVLLLGPVRPQYPRLEGLFLDEPGLRIALLAAHAEPRLEAHRPPGVVLAVAAYSVVPRLLPQALHHGRVGLAPPPGPIRASALAPAAAAAAGAPAAGPGVPEDHGAEVRGELSAALELHTHLHAGLDVAHEASHPAAHPLAFVANLDGSPGLLKEAHFVLVGLRSFAVLRKGGQVLLQLPADDYWKAWKRGAEVLILRKQRLHVLPDRRRQRWLLHSEVTEVLVV